MYEYEFRLTVSLRSKDELQHIISTFDNVKKYTVIYLEKHFRRKNGIWEFKKIKKQVQTFYAGLWFKFVESKELAFHNFGSKRHDQFYKNSGYRQNPYTYEYRNEMCLSDKAKLYTFEKDQQYGLVFEYEHCTSKKKLKVLPIRSKKLEPYRDVFPLFSNKEPMPFMLNPCERKPVYHTSHTPNHSLVAAKHDGIFGIVMSYKNHICEYWEGNDYNPLEDASIGDGIVFGAEKMEDGSVILLDVYQVRGLPVVHTESVLLEYLPQLQNLPPHYRVQKYYKRVKDIPTEELTDTDGIIYHSINDIIYKCKPRKTIDLMYQDGFFIVGDQKVITDKSLVNGAVYECDAQFNVIKRRLDRFTGNSAKQLAEVL